MVSNDVIDNICDFYILDHALNNFYHHPIILKIRDTWFNHNKPVKNDSSFFLTVKNSKTNAC